LSDPKTLTIRITVIRGQPSSAGPQPKSGRT
jgi:hypothetical protein